MCHKWERKKRVAFSPRVSSRHTGKNVKTQSTFVSECNILFTLIILSSTCISLLLSECVCVCVLHVYDSVTIVFIYLCNVACCFVALPPAPLSLVSIVINSYLLLHRWVTWRNGNFFATDLFLLINSERERERGRVERPVACLLLSLSLSRDRAARMKEENIASYFDGNVVSIISRKCSSLCLLVVCLFACLSVYLFACCLRYADRCSEKRTREKSDNITICEIFDQLECYSSKLLLLLRMFTQTEKHVEERKRVEVASTLCHRDRKRGRARWW